MLEFAIGIVIAVSLLCCTGCSPVGASFPVASPDAGVEYGKFHGCYPVWALWGVVGIAQKVDAGRPLVLANLADGLCAVNSPVIHRMLYVENSLVSF
ncbi:hypothetical protein [Thiothrix subterranea]|uniref:Uncharacterized protein n=1 Tax=Thiothrix subterranea TaxID=2735563 RepID=A0AA51MNZ7_9GAMM|nr:hypothetical protein [Thiothrix subterranea]MDQ5767935.1 hypothetical protein [Thiothrix subterranea]WML86606.1 hypothetical protein RCG00_20265 [Thiothrix subterranea]